MYAIIETGGKQYRVRQGDLLQVELLEPGAEQVEFSRVHLLSNGQQAIIGTPYVPGARVVGTVVGTGRRAKILVFKRKRRKHYKRTIGHRQYFSAVRIQSIDSGGALLPLPGAEAEAKPASRTRPAKKKAAPARRAAGSAKKAPARSTKKAAPPASGRTGVASREARIKASKKPKGGAAGKGGKQTGKK
jgi:large subunit ribosomal protein L21